MENIENFKIIGIETKTTNEDGKASDDLGKLWEQFFAKNVPNQIVNKKSDEIFAIYTDYESDYTGEYTCVIGMKVHSLDKIPDELIGREFESGKYQKFIAKGEMPSAVVETWKDIWAKDKELNRKYTADFEVYGGKSQNGENSEVEIYIAKK
ncbi:GyrI-like domain-containing protein [Winogradskyella sp. SM1960]|uniref:GyrI-like domain-containing protein n=1 Tax=Winogradskyella sp. SM1960 TaxID=2865955 RepID=UPI001CD2E12F|nr:GyrI-like domain-containing protein [Winogradskyella sp. SM1960]